MRDFEAIDRQLRELGEPPADRAQLLARILGQDRSRARLEQLLDEALAAAPQLREQLAAIRASAPEPQLPYGEPARPVQAAMSAAVLSHDTVVGPPPVSPAADQTEPELDPEGPRHFDASESEPAPAPMFDGGRDSSAPSLELSAPEPEPEPERPVDDSSRFAALFDYTNPPPPRASQPTSAGFPSDATAPAAAARDRYAVEPTDEEPTGHWSPPASVAPPAAAEADPDADAEEADFELLVEDEEIIEIDDEELQIVDDE